MTIAFNADEALRMAERIESDAAAFYRKAAAGHARERDCSFLLRLAAMEDEHRKFFAALRQQLSDKEKELPAYAPYEEATLCFTWASRTWFPRPSAKAGSTGSSRKRRATSCSSPGNCMPSGTAEPAGAPGSYRHPLEIHWPDGAMPSHGTRLL